MGVVCSQEANPLREAAMSRVVELVQQTHSGRY